MVNVVTVARYYVMVTTNACRCATVRARIIARNLRISTTRVLVVTAPDICGMFCVVLRTLTLLLFKVRLYRAIRSTTLLYTFKKALQKSCGTKLDRKVGLRVVAR